MPLYAVTIFLSAFLLFQLQLIIAKVILPWFGGSAAVWTTCLLFFQVVLLLGYLYAHWSIRSLSPKAQRRLHLFLLAVSLFFLPMTPAGHWKPVGPEHPVAGILGLLAATVGLPYLLLSTTSPLLQAWFARTHRGTIPYRLFALSNAGSMLGLLSYPAAVEPFLSVRGQTLGLTLGYLAYGLLCAVVALRGAAPAEEAFSPNLAARSEAPGVLLSVLWILLAACPSVLLLAVTNHLTQDVAAIPFLWIIPLCLYLASFILCFSLDGRLYRRTIYLPLLVPALGGMAYVLSLRYPRLSLALGALSGGLFVACMVCHGELARLKPHPDRLTSYYLMVSLGGALGGIFVGLAAPRLFTGYYELHVGLFACAALVTFVLAREKPAGRPGLPRRALIIVPAAALTIALGVYVMVQARRAEGSSRLAARNFYGVLRVNDWDVNISPIALREMVHGVIPHGSQFLSPERRRQPTAYYGPRAGGGLAILNHRRELPQRVGLIGLGAGTLAVYGRPGDYYRFYEINPLVIRLAAEEFTYLRDSQAKIDVVPGDARLSLEREPPQNFDILVVDAFSSDSIPVHLLTKEAFELYFRHLREGGVVALHVSNGYLDLLPVIGRLARALGKYAFVVSSADEVENAIHGSDWVLVSGRTDLFAKLGSLGKFLYPKPSDSLRIWTDDYSNLLGTLK